MEAEEEMKRIKGRKEGKPIGLYPKGGLMVINSDMLSDKGTGNCVEKIRTWTKDVCKNRLEEKVIEWRNKDAETIRRGREEIVRIMQEIKEQKEILQNIRRLEQEEEKRRKPVLNEEKKIDFSHSGSHRKG